MEYIRIDKGLVLVLVIVLILGTFSTGFVSAIHFDDDDDDSDINEILQEKNDDEQKYNENHIKNEKEQRTDRLHLLGEDEAFLQDNFSDMDSKISGPRLDSSNNFRERGESVFGSRSEYYYSRESIKIDSDEDFKEKAAENNWPGDGTEENPYIIEGYEIIMDEDDPGYGIYIGNTTVHFVVRDCYIEDQFEGIILSNVTNYAIENNEVRGLHARSREIKISESNSGFIINNTILGPGPYAVQLFESHGNIIHNNSIGTEGYPVRLERSNQNEISGNDMSRSDQGVFLLLSDNNTLKDNSAMDLRTSGFQIVRSDNTYLQNNMISGGGHWGHPLELYMANGTTIIDNTLKFRRSSAMTMERSKDVTLINNQIDSQNDIIMIDVGIMISGPRLEHWNTHKIEDSNTVNGEPVQYLADRREGSIIEEDLEQFGQLILANCTEMTIENQTFKDDDPILMGFSDDNIIYNNEFYNMSNPLVISESIGNEISENNFSENHLGLWLKGANNNLITDNTFLDNGNGIRVEGIDNKVIQNFFSLIDGPVLSAINIEREGSNQIYQNRIDNLRIGIQLRNTENNEIIENEIKNTFDGIELIGAENNEVKENDIKNPSTSGIAVRRAKNNSLMQNTITDGGRGILVGTSNNNTLSENVVFNSSNGVVLNNSYNNTAVYNILKMNKHGGFNVTGSNKNIFTRNTITDNLNGLKLYSSDDNVIEHNNLSENDLNGLELRLSNDNIVENNTISSSGMDGVLLEDNSNRNIFNRNTVARNEGYGVFITYSHDNLLYHNRFIENEDQALDTEDNIWNKSYPIGGNYWSDHTGPDDYSGPDQDEAGSDGIVDRARNIEGFEPHGKDHYPWTNPDFVSPVHITDPHPSDESERVIHRTSLSVYVEADLFPTTVVFYLDGEEMYEETIENEGRVETPPIDFDLNTAYDWQVEAVNDEGANRTISPSYSFTTVSEKLLYELKVDIDEGEGTIKVDGVEIDVPYSEEYPLGKELELEAVPADGYRFVGWEGDHPLEGSESAHIEIVIDENMSLTANFRKGYELTINISGKGTVIVDGEEVKDDWTGVYKEGTEVHLEASPDDGWEFDEWQGTNETGKEITITIDEDKEITAVFEEDEDGWIPGFPPALLLLAVFIAVAIYRKKKRRGKTI